MPKLTQAQLMTLYALVADRIFALREHLRKTPDLDPAVRRSHNLHIAQLVDLRTIIDNATME